MKMIRVEMEHSMAEKHHAPGLAPGDVFTVKRGKVFLTSLRIPEVLKGKHTKSMLGQHWTSFCNM